MDKVLIYDLSNVLYSSFFNTQKEKALNTESDKKEYWRYLIVKELLNVRRKFNPKEFILAIDDSKNWRKDVFPYYKARRIFKKKDSPIDWDYFYSCINEFIDELNKSFPCKAIKVDNAEADDVIAILALNMKDDKEVIIASRDKDFQQLLVYDNIKIYNLNEYQMLQCEDPSLFTMIHVLKGDSGDDIPNLLSDDNVFVNSDKRQKRVTEKVIREMLEEGLEKYAIKRKLINNYERNCKLIKLDLDCIPEKIQTETLYKYNTFKSLATYETLMDYIRSKHMYALLEEI